MALDRPSESGRLITRPRDSEDQGQGPGERLPRSACTAQPPRRVLLQRGIDAGAFALSHRRRIDLQQATRQDNRSIEVATGDMRLDSHFKGFEVAGVPSLPIQRRPLLVGEVQREGTS